MGAYNLGGFASQLSPGMSEDELLRAYQAAGGSPAELAPPPPQTQEQPAPRRAPQAMTVAPAPGNPTQALAGYDAATWQGANERMAQAAQSGTDQAATHDQAGELYGQQAEGAKRDAQNARTRADAAREEGDYYSGEARRVYDEMKAHSNPPGPKAIEKVMGILGGVLAMGGKGGAAHGAQLIGSLLGSGVDRERWAAEQEHNTKLFQMATSGKAGANADESHQFDVAQKMIAADAHYYDAAIAKVKESGLSKEATAAATRLQMDIRDKALEYGRALEMQKQKAAAAAGANRRNSFFWQVPLEQLRSMPSEVLGKEGQKVLAERTKQDQSARGGELDIAGKQIGQEKSLRDLAAQGAEGPYQKGVGGEIPGLVATKPVQQITQKDYQDAQQIQAAGQDMNVILGKLSKLQGDMSMQARQEYYNLFPILLGKVNVLANAGVLNPGEVKVWEERLPKHVIDNATTLNPVARVKSALVDEQQQYSALQSSLQDMTDNALRVRGFARQQQAPAQQQAAAATVRMINPATGRVIVVDPSRPGALETARAHGLVPADQAPSGPAVASAPPARGYSANRILGGR